MSQIQDCLIVAAGKGTRLKGLGDSKPLVELAGTPLIEHAMLAASAAGVQNFVIVTGYQAARLTAAVGQMASKHGWNIKTVFNPDFHLSNGLSVLCGMEHLSAEFYLAMCDHFVEPELYRALAEAELPSGAVGLGIDFRLDNPMVDLEDVTKVELDAGHIKNISKSLTSYNGFDTGIFRANPNLFKAIESAHANTGDCSISGGMEILAAQGLALGIDVGSANWIDVDSEDMHVLAERWLAETSVSNSG